MPADKEIRKDLISRYINGKMMPGPIRLKAIAEALDIDARELQPTAAVEAPATGKMRMTAVGGENVLIEIEKTVTLTTATKILELIASEPR